MKKTTKKTNKKSKVAKKPFGEWEKGYNAGVDSVATMLREQGYPHLSKVAKFLLLKINA